MKTYQEVRLIDVSKHVEKKDNLSYLSWAWAWDEFKQAYPDAYYEVVKNERGLPYFEDVCGAMVYTRVTANNQTYEMWLPIMDSRNRAMKREPYSVQTHRGSIQINAFTMFDVNKTLMRCLVKNLAMFGLGLYIYAGEDLPEKEEDVEINKITINPAAVKELKMPEAFKAVSDRNPPPIENLDFHPSDLDVINDAAIVGETQSLSSAAVPLVPFGKNKGLPFELVGVKELSKSIWAAQKGLEEKAAWIDKVGTKNVQHFIVTATHWIDSKVTPDVP